MSAESRYSPLLEILLRHREEPLSGESISRSLGVTRSAVWKEIEALRKQGYEISSATNRGYRLERLPNLLSPQLIAFYYPDCLNRIRYYSQTDSTNTRGQILALEGTPDGTAVIADSQTGGSGRMGRSFHSPSGVGLYYSYVLRPDCSVEQLSLLTSYAGLAVCHVIRRLTGLDAQIKWPNDIILDRRKVCGILTKLVSDGESSQITHAVIGIGVNLLQDSFPEELKDKAISLRMAGAGEVSRAQFAAELTRELDTIFLRENWLRLRPQTALDELKALSCTVGCPVTVSAYGEERRGRAVGIAPDGGLIVDYDDGTHETVSSGEVSVRGILGYLPVQEGNL